MSKSSSNLLFLAVGAAIGAAVGYVAAYDKRNELLQDIVDYAYKIKDGIQAAAHDGKEELKEAVGDVMEEVTEKINAKK